MTKLSVNINKVATLRNARGGNNPDVVQVALDCEKFGAQGITVHPRPDERHIRYQDVYDLKAVLRTEFNIEGNPVDKFNDLVLKVRPTQVTLVPDAPDQITSNAGWATKKNLSFLTEIIGDFKEKGFVLPFCQCRSGDGGICGKSGGRPGGTLYGAVRFGLCRKSGGGCPAFCGSGPNGSQFGIGAERRP